MRRLLGFITKEFIHIFRDLRTLIVLFGIPVTQILLFGYVITMEINDSSIAILDLSKDEVSLNLSDRLCSSGFFRQKENLNGYDDIERVLRSGKVKAVVVFGEGFGCDLITRGKASMSIIADGTEPNYATLVCNYITAIVNDFSREQNEVETGTVFLLQPEVRMFFNPELKDQFMFVPGVMAYVLIIICALMTSITITREKEFGTMEALLVSPLRAGHIIVGKVVPYMVLSFVTLVVILWVSWLVFELPIRGSLGLLIGISMLYILLGLSLGIFISTISKNMQQAIFISLMSLLLPTIILSGFIFPVENMPKAYDVASYLVPSKYYLIAIKNIMIKGLGIGYVWKETLAMCFMSAIFILLSIKNFKERLQ
ncbi:MAG TPA: ABC transporter permease [Tenuifilaceae bacterium]|nr:ABC transporter permease [Tenuifilaceae bacterium]